MHYKKLKKEILTIPNLLSLFRLILIPVYIYIYVNAQVQRDYVLASAILAVSCLTDLVDGKIARRFNMVTTIGKILDPLADKLTQFSLILCLASNYSVLWYLIALFFVKELFQLVAGAINFRKGKMLKGALFSGKICTTILFISLIVMVLLPNLDAKVVNWITIIDGIFLTIAFADYVTAYFTKNTKFQLIQKENDT